MPAMQRTVWVWTVQLDARDCAWHWELLSGDERERASRFRFAIHRNRYVRCRGAVRLILGQALRCQPQAVRLAYSPFGKPELAACHRTDDLRFNVSHCENFAVIAIARGVSVGVDVEHAGRLADFDDIARGVLPEIDYRELTAAGPNQRARVFYRSWTRREAWLKATGQGISKGMKHFSFVPTPMNSLRVVDQNGSVIDDWHVRDLALPAPYLGALATSASIEEVSVHAFTAPKGAVNAMWGATA